MPPPPISSGSAHCSTIWRASRRSPRLLDSARRRRRADLHRRGEQTVLAVGLVGDRQAVPRRGRAVVGVVGVIGPTRLNYARVVPMVDFTATTLIEADGMTEIRRTPTKTPDDEDRQRHSDGRERTAEPRREIAEPDRGGRAQGPPCSTPQAETQNVRRRLEREDRRARLCDDRLRPRHARRRRQSGAAPSPRSGRRAGLRGGQDRHRGDRARTDHGVRRATASPASPATARSSTPTATRR